MKVEAVEAMALLSVSAEEKEELKEKLRLFNTKKEFYLNMYAEDERGFWIPRAITKRPADNANWSEYKFNHSITLNPTQQSLVSEFLDSLKDNPCGGIIASGTGTGKTIIGLYLIAHFGLKSLVIVPTDRIFHQWIDRCKQFLGIVPSVIRGALCEYDSPVTIAMLQTLRKDKFAFLKKEFGIVVFDEIHTISTEHFHTVAMKFWSKVNIGLSATPYRKDGMGNVFIWHIGKILATSNRVNMKPKVMVINYYNPSTSHTGCVWNGDLQLGRYINRLCRCSHRNTILAKLLKNAYDKGHNVLLLTERLNHIDTLAKLAENLGVKKEDIGKLTANKKEIDKQVIIGTYGSAGLGLDIPRLSCIILATPRTDIVQPVGRILRTKDRDPIVIDIVDEYSEIMKKWYVKREKYYKVITDKPIVYVMINSNKKEEKDDTQ